MADSNESDADRFSRRTALKGLGAGVGFTTLAGCLSTLPAGTGSDLDHPPDSWPQFGKNISNTAHNPGTAPPRDNITEKWTVNIGDLWNGPAVVDGTLYIGDGSREHYNLWSIDAETGNVNWKKGDAESDIMTTPSVVNGSIYFVDANSVVHSMDAENGESQWHFQLPGVGVPASTTVVEGIVYCGTYEGSNGTCVALNADNGDELWRYKVPEGSDSYVQQAPGVQAADESEFENGTVFISATRSEHVYALDAQTGTERWRFDANNEVYSAPVVTDGTVYVGSISNRVHALNAETGDEIWKSPPLDSNVYASPAVDDERVYVGTHMFHSADPNNSIYALDRETGDLLWRTKTGNVSNAPAVTRNTVYVGTVGHGHITDTPDYFYALEAETGDVVWTRETGEVLGAPAVVNGSVYWGTNDGLIHAIEEAE